MNNLFNKIKASNDNHFELKDLSANEIARRSSLVSELNYDYQTLKHYYEMKIDENSLNVNYLHIIIYYLYLIIKEKNKYYLS
jgi:hypothetical protein